MIDRDQIERLLRLNGVSSDAGDEKIAALLQQLNWGKSDIERGLKVLHGEPEAVGGQAGGILARLSRTDEAMSPAMVTALLGIEMNVRDKDISARRQHSEGLTLGQVVSIIGAAVLMACIYIIVSMWVLKIGFFEQI